MQRPQRLARHDGLFGGLRRFPPLLGRQMHYRIETGIALLDALDEVIHHLDRRQFPGLDGIRNAAG